VAADAIIAKAREAGLHASVVGHAGGAAFASKGDKGELFSIPVAHLREWHEGWMPGWLGDAA
jgi:phosphoribosylformylglycinamidine synthase